MEKTRKFPIFLDTNFSDLNSAKKEGAFEYMTNLSAKKWGFSKNTPKREQGRL